MAEIFKFPEGEIWHEHWREVVKINAVGYLRMTELIDHLETKLPLLKRARLNIANTVGQFHIDNNRFFRQGGMITASCEIIYSSQINVLELIKSPSQHQHLTVPSDILSELSYEIAKNKRSLPKFYYKEEQFLAIPFLARLLNKNLSHIQMQNVRITDSSVAAQSLMNIIRFSRRN